MCMTNNIQSSSSLIKSVIHITEPKQNYNIYTYVFLTHFKLNPKLI